ncbi:MAG: DsrE family protein [Trueperaceae bacterium]|nr:DsrE family protein [Trueperaceae bacterium]
MVDFVASAAERHPTTSNGWYDLERMLRGIVQMGATIGACGTCMDARGIPAEERLDGVHRSDMNELGDRTMEADQVIVF